MDGGRARRARNHTYLCTTRHWARTTRDSENLRFGGTTTAGASSLWWEASSGSSARWRRANETKPAAFCHTAFALPQLYYPFSYNRKRHYKPNAASLPGTPTLDTAV